MSDNDAVQLTSPFALRRSKVPANDRGSAAAGAIAATAARRPTRREDWVKTFRPGARGAATAIASPEALTNAPCRGCTARSAMWGATRTRAHAQHHRHEQWSQIWRGGDAREDG